MQILRKYFWQLSSILFAVITIVLALISIVVAYDVFQRSRPIKELQVLIDSPISIVDVKPEAKGNIEVLYKGKSVSSVISLQIQIKNSGNQPILESDYGRPLSFSFDPKVELIDVTVTKSEPPNIGMVISKTLQYRAEAVPTLLNANDAVTVRFVAIGTSSDSVLTGFKVDGRIVGIKEISTVMSSEQKPSVLGENPAILVVLTVILGVIAAFVNFLGHEILPSLVRRLLRKLVFPDGEAVVITSDESGEFAETRDGPWKSAVACNPIYPGWPAIKEAKWIWIKEKPSDQEAQEGQIVWHRLKFGLPTWKFFPRLKVWSSATLSLMVDDFAHVYLNGKPVGDRIAIDRVFHKYSGLLGAL